MTDLGEKPVCSCGLYSGQTCSRQPCLLRGISAEEVRQAYHQGVASATWRYAAQSHQFPLVPQMPFFREAMQPIGCICPPGANKECENPACPRKSHINVTSSGV